MESLVVRSDLVCQMQVTPACSKTGKIDLFNDADTPVAVRLQTADYSFNANGETFFQEPETSPRSNASWIEISQDYIVIPAKGQADVFYTVHVPDDDQLIGSYWSVILIEPDTVDTKRLKDKDSEFQLHIKVRYANLVVCNLPKGTPSVAILDTKLVEQDAQRYFFIDVANNGTLYLNPTLTLKLYDSQGRLQLDSTTTPEKIVPSSSKRFSVDVSKLKEQNYQGFLLLDNGDETVFGHRLELRIP